MSYPGGVWRYAVRAGAHRFVIDDQRKYQRASKCGSCCRRPRYTSFQVPTEAAAKTGRSNNDAKLIALLAGAALVALPGMPASAETVLNVITAGDQNMVDYINDYLGPKFEADHPGVTVRAVGTGPGDAGSLKIFEKLDAESKAGTANWDIDVAVVHQRGAAQMLGDQLAGEVSRRDHDRQAGHARHRRKRAGHRRHRLCHADVQQPDRHRLQSRGGQGSAEDLRRARASGSPTNPKQFGYNGIKGGMSGVGFVMGWVEAKTGDADKLEKGPYDPAEKPKIDEALTAMKPFNANVTMTPGQRRHARHAEPRRDRHGAGVGRHVLHLASATAR